MNQKLSATLCAAFVLLPPTPAPAGAGPGEASVLFARMSQTECRQLAREERRARRRGDAWRADQLKDEYDSECGGRG